MSEAGRRGIEEEIAGLNQIMDLGMSPETYAAAAARRSKLRAELAAKTQEELDMQLQGYITPPEGQGQIVEVSYGVLMDDGAWPCMRVHDRTDNSRTYYRADTETTDAWQPWNCAPTGYHWRRVDTDPLVQP